MTQAPDGGTGACGADLGREPFLMAGARPASAYSDSSTRRAAVDVQSGNGMYITRGPMNAERFQPVPPSTRRLAYAKMPS